MISVNLSGWQRSWANGDLDEFDYPLNDPTTPLMPIEDEPKEDFEYTEPIDEDDDFDSDDDDEEE